VLSSNVVKKKNLLADKLYCFSVRPVVPGEEYEYGPSSTAFTVATLSRHFKNIFPSSLQTNTRTGLGSVPTADALAGKVVLLYFSAHWCGPCRAFTPQLVTLYQLAKMKKRDIEVVFCSADHSEDEFESYYKEHMPWLAIPYDEDSREALPGMFKVSGIPRLVVLAPSGKVLVDNAGGHPLTLDSVDSWIAMSK
jgi:thiol-disulfide isomerase/thioredoxin